MLSPLVAVWPAGLLRFVYTTVLDRSASAMRAACNLRTECARVPFHTLENRKRFIANRRRLEIWTMLSPHEFSMLLRIARAHDSVDLSNHAYAVLVEQRLVDDAPRRVQAVVPRPALTPNGWALLARFGEAA